MVAGGCNGLTYDLYFVESARPDDAMVEAGPLRVAIDPASAALLDGAVIAEAAAAKLPADHPDRAFYAGKRYAAQFFAANQLATVAARAQQIAKEDRTMIDIPVGGFAP